MSELSLSPAERARKAHSKVLQRLQEPAIGVALAASLGVSESTVSRIKNERLEECLAFLYAAGFKVVAQGKVCVDSDELRMLRQTYARAVQNEQVAALMFGGDE